MTEARDVRVIRVRPSIVYLAQLQVELERDLGLTSRPGVVALASAGPWYPQNPPGEVFSPTPTERLRRFFSGFLRRNLSR